MAVLGGQLNQGKVSLGFIAPEQQERGNLLVGLRAGGAQIK